MTNLLGCLAGLCDAVASPIFRACAEEVFPRLNTCLTDLFQLLRRNPAPSPEEPPNPAPSPEEPPKPPPSPRGVQREDKLHLYIHQYVSGENVNQTVQLSPGTKNFWGWVVILDWTIREGSAPDSKVIARAQGTQIQCGQNYERWHNYVTIVFEDERYRGSTLIVSGYESKYEPLEWAIVGGTGKFALAQGIVSVTVLSVDEPLRLTKLSMNVFYRTIDRSTVGDN